MALLECGNFAGKLPVDVIEQDRKLSKAADQLCELRWHWTLDETNPERVTFSGYARAVGTDEARIRNDAHAWKEYKNSAGAGRIPGKPKTVGKPLKLSVNLSPSLAMVFLMSLRSD